MQQKLPNFSILQFKKAILFDMDGTLFDTEGLHAQALCNVLLELGHHYSAAEIQKKYYGWCDTDVFKELLGHSIDAESLVAKKNDQLSREIQKLGKKGLLALQTPGMEELLEKLLDQKMPMALISASEKRIVDLVVKVGELDCYFTAVVGREEGRRSKPFPDPYLYAMELLQVTPQDVIIFEDSPTGLRSAFDTGAQVIRIAHSIDQDDSLAADLKQIPSIANYCGLIF